MMKIRQIRKLIFAASFVAISSCGYDGGYRYECQDPANWDAEECNPPMCLVDGMCTETLLGFNPNTTEETVDTIPAEQTEDTVAP
jgi:hypothetical protein